MAVRFRIDEAKIRRIVREGVERAVWHAALQGVVEAQTLLSSVDATVDTSGSRQLFTKGSSPGQPPARRSGFLLRSVSAVKLAVGRAAFGTNVAYGRYLEFGAHIKARRSKWLTIPVHAAAVSALKRQGVAGGGVVSARNIPGLKFRPVNDNLAFLVRQRKGKDDEIWFVLKREVTVAPRPWMRRILADPAARGRIMAEALRAARESMKGTATVEAIA